MKEEEPRESKITEKSNGVGSSSDSEDDES